MSDHNPIELVYQDTAQVESIDLGLAEKQLKESFLEQLIKID